MPQDAEKVMTRDEFFQIRELIRYQFMWDGHLQSKAVRNDLVANGMVATFDGWNAATEKGLRAYYFSLSANIHRARAWFSTVRR